MHSFISVRLIFTCNRVEKYCLSFRPESCFLGSSFCTHAMYPNSNLLDSPAFFVLLNLRSGSKELCQHYRCQCFETRFSFHSHVTPMHNLSTSFSGLVVITCKNYFQTCFSTATQNIPCRRASSPNSSITPCVPAYPNFRIALATLSYSCTSFRGLSPGPLLCQFV